MRNLFVVALVLLVAFFFTQFHHLQNHTLEAAIYKEAEEVGLVVIGEAFGDFNLDGHEDIVAVVSQLSDQGDLPKEGELWEGTIDEDGHFQLISKVAHFPVLSFESVDHKSLIQPKNEMDMDNEGYWLEHHLQIDALLEE